MTWPTKKLGECLVQFDRGISWSRSDEGGSVAVLRIPNIEEGHINLDDLKHINVKNENGELEKNDIVMVASNGNPNLVGRCALVTETETGMRFASFLVRLRFNDTKLLPQYAHLFLLTPVFKRELRRKIATTSGIYNLRKVHIEKVKIPFPPLQIQKQIVERMDKIAEAQKLNDELIQKADELYRSLLHNELNAKLKNQNVKLQFKIQKLEEIAEVTSSKRVFQSEYVTQGVPFYRTKEIVELSRGKPISLELFISEKHFDEIKNKFGVPQKDDILISAVGTIGISWMVSDNRKFYFKDGNLLWIKNFDDIDPSYLKIVLDNFLKAISKLSAGAAYNALTIIKLKKVKIPIPPLEIQKQIVAKLSAAQEYKKQLLAQKSKLKEFFDSVLHQAFRGAL